MSTAEIKKPMTGDTTVDKNSSYEANVAGEEENKLPSAGGAADV
jgi:hypothetical protein